MKKIIHIDMDCFFAAVEMRDRPDWRNIPLAIGGSRTERGVISTCNYPARVYGVRAYYARQPFNSGGAVYHLHYRNVHR